MNGDSATDLRLATAGEGALWVAASAAGDKDPYVIRRLYRVSESRAPEVIHEAARVLGQRHEQLAVRYTARRNSLRVEGADPIPVVQHDLGVDDVATMQALLETTPCAPGGPVATLVSFAIDGVLTHVGLVIHHLVADLTSMSIIVRDLALAMSAGLGDRPPTRRYAECPQALMPRDSSSDEGVAPKPLERAPFPLSERWAGDPADSYEHNFSVARHKDRGITPFARTVLAAQVAASLLTGEHEDHIGFIFGGRPPGFAETVGYFIRVAPIRVEYRRHDSVGDVLRRIDADLADADKSERPTSKFGSPRVMVEHLTGLELGQGVPWPLIEEKLDITPVAKFDLEFRVRTAGSEDHVRALLRRAVLEELSAPSLRAIFAAVASAALSTTIADIGPLISGPPLPSSKRGPIGDWTQHAARSTSRVDDPVRGRFSIGSLARSLIPQIRDRTVSTQPVVLSLPRSAELIAAEVALSTLGIPFVPVDPAYPSRRRQSIVDQARPQFAISAEDSPIPGVEIWKPDWSYTTDAEVSTTKGSLDGAFCMLFTSGSTGEPKGTVLGRAGFENFVDWYVREVDLSSRDRCLVFSSPGFDVSLMEIWPAAAVGADLVIVDEIARYDPTRLQRFIIEQNVTCAFVATQVAQQLIDLDWPRCSLRVLVTAGETLRRYPRADLPFRFVNGYGPTEATVLATVDDVVPDAEYKIPSIGRPIAGVDVWVCDADGSPLPKGCLGEAVIAGAGVGMGYVGGQRGGFRARIDGAPAYFTGDLVRQRPDGRLDFIGRRDRQVKMRGFRIELADVEAALLSVIGVKAAAAVVVETGRGQDLAAVVVTDRNVDAVRAALAAEVPAYMVPGSIVTVEALPLSAHAKVDIAAVEALVRSGAPALRREVSAVETMSISDVVTAAWERTFPGVALTSDADFLEIGGDSLRAAILVGELSDALSEELSLALPFIEPKLNGQIDLIASATRGEIEWAEL